MNKKLVIIVTAFTAIIGSEKAVAMQISQDEEPNTALRLYIPDANFSPVDSTNEIVIPNVSSPENGVDNKVDLFNGESLCTISGDSYIEDQDMEDTLMDTMPEKPKISDPKKWSYANSAWMDGDSSQIMHNADFIGSMKLVKQEETYSTIISLLSKQKYGVTEWNIVEKALSKSNSSKEDSCELQGIFEQTTKNAVVQKSAVEVEIKWLHKNKSVSDISLNERSNKFYVRLSDTGSSYPKLVVSEK